jgi:putative tributyrin esterase
MKLCGLVILSCVLGTTGCDHSVAIPDHPQLIPQVRLIDGRLQSAALTREMRFRIVVPALQPQAGSLPVVYLLHGAGTDYHDWTNNSQIAFLASQGFVLVFPDEPGAYYINEASGRNRRYEDFFVDELIPQVHRLVPYVSWGREDNAVVGISRGGYGAVVLGLKHSDTFGYVGDLSGAVDFPERRFRWKTPWASMGNRRVFGPVGSPENLANDPFSLARVSPSSKAPYFFIFCGDQDSLVEPNRHFANLLAHRGFQSELHIVHGGHNWETWGTAIPLLEASLTTHLHTRMETVTQ